MIFIEQQDINVATRIPNTTYLHYRSHMLSGWSAELCNDGGARRPVSALQTMDVSSGGGLPSDKCMADARYGPFCANRSGV